jgi:hypothetical protein
MDGWRVNQKSGLRFFEWLLSLLSLAGLGRLTRVRIGCEP